MRLANDDRLGGLPGRHAERDLGGGIVKDLWLDEDTRAALRRMVERRSPDQGKVIRRVTRRGARRSAGLAEQLISGEAEGTQVLLTKEADDGTTLEIRVLGVHRLGDASILE